MLLGGDIDYLILIFLTRSDRKRAPKSRGNGSNSYWYTLIHRYWEAMFTSVYTIDISPDYICLVDIAIGSRHSSDPPTDCSSSYSSHRRRKSHIKGNGQAPPDGAPGRGRTARQVLLPCRWVGRPLHRTPKLPIAFTKDHLLRSTCPQSNYSLLSFDRMRS